MRTTQTSIIVAQDGPIMGTKTVISLFVPLHVKTVERVFDQTSAVVELVTKEIFVMELLRVHTWRHVTLEDVMETISVCVLKISEDLPV